MNPFSSFSPEHMQTAFTVMRLVFGTRYVHNVPKWLFVLNLLYFRTHDPVCLLNYSLHISNSMHAHLHASLNVVFPPPPPHFGILQSELTFQNGTGCPFPWQKRKKINKKELNVLPIRLSWLPLYLNYCAVVTPLVFTRDSFCSD